MKYAILIDAGFLKRKLGSHSEPLDIGGVHAFLAALRAQEALANMRLHRVYWYDAPATWKQRPGQRLRRKPLNRSPRTLLVVIPFTHFDVVRSAIVMSGCR